MKKRQKDRKKGQAIAEYLILTALIAIASISVLQLLSSNIRRKIAVVSNAIMGNTEARIEGKKAESKHFEVIDMDSFDKAIVDRDEN